MKNSLLKSSAIRALRTFCQVLITLFGTDLIGFTDVDWIRVVSVAGMSALIAFLQGIIAGLPEADTTSLKE